MWYPRSSQHVGSSMIWVAYAVHWAYAVRYGTDLLRRENFFFMMPFSPLSLSVASFSAASLAMNFV